MRVNSSASLPKQRATIDERAQGARSGDLPAEPALWRRGGNRDVRAEEARTWSGKNTAETLPHGKRSTRVDSVGEFRVSVVKDVNVQTVGAQGRPVPIASKHR